jgi:hypothetical protein
MYTCSYKICDPVCDFCKYCVHNDNGEPVSCSLNNYNDFDDSTGYCDEFKCRLHEI